MAMEQVDAGVVEMFGYSKGAGGGCTMMLLGICLLPFAGIGIIFIIIALFMGGSAKKIYRCSLCKNPVAAADVRVCPSCRAPLKPILSWIERMDEKTRQGKAEIARIQALQAEEAARSAGAPVAGVAGPPASLPMTAAAVLPMKPPRASGEPGGGGAN